MSRNKDTRLSAVTDPLSSPTSLTRAERARLAQSETLRQAPADWRRLAAQEQARGNHRLATEYRLLAEQIEGYLAVTDRGAPCR